MSSPPELLWSKRGEIACRVHAPAEQSSRYLDEGWTLVPPPAASHRVRYQCQHCSGQGPLRHRTSADRGA